MLTQPRHTIRLACFLLLTGGGTANAYTTQTVPQTTRLETETTFRVGIGERMTGAQLLLDTAYGPDLYDKVVSVADASGPTCGIRAIERRLEPCIGTDCSEYTIKMKAPLWRSGDNRTGIRLNTTKTSHTNHYDFHYEGDPYHTRRVEMDIEEAPGSPTPKVGNPSEQVFRSTTGAFFGLIDVPSQVSQCVGVCADTDKDGLNDLWESLVVKLMSPDYRFDE